MQSRLARACAPGFVIDLIAESRRVDDGEGNASAFLVEFCKPLPLVMHPRPIDKAAAARTDCDGLDLDAFLNVGDGWVVRVLVVENPLAAQSIDESGAPCTRNN